MSDCIILRTLSCCSHKFSTRCRAQVPCALFFFLSIRSCTDSFRSLSQCFSSSFRAHPDFISRAMISPLSRFPSCYYFLATFSTPFLCRLPRSVISRAATRVRSHAILLRAADSSPATPFTHPPHLILLPARARARVSFLSVRRTLESHKEIGRAHV